MESPEKYTVYAEHALGRSGLIANYHNLLETIEVCLLVSPSRRVLVVAGVPAEAPRSWESPEAELAST